MLYDYSMMPASEAMPFLSAVADVVFYMVPTLRASEPSLE